MQKRVTNATFGLANKQRNSLRANQMRHLNGARFASALEQFRAKTAIVGICGAFAFVTETTLKELKHCSKNENTAKSTGFWLSVSKNWCVDKEITDEIENYELAELNSQLKTNCPSISTPKTNNKKGEDYEPESLKVVMASLDRYLRNKGCTLSIVGDREFSSSKDVWEDKAKQLRLAGRGKHPNKARQV